MDHKIRSASKRGLRVLAIATGVMAYLPIALIIKESYLVPGSSDFSKDIILFSGSILIIVVILFVWRAIYKQFRKDRTRLGFESDKNGVILTLEIIVETVIPFLIIYYLSSGF